MSESLSRNVIKEKLLNIIVGIVRKLPPTPDNLALNHDLGIGGDDAWELIDSIQKTFGTDFADFDFEQYFPNETDALFDHFGKLLGLKNKKKRLTVGHLVSIIERGAWYE